MFGAVPDRADELCDRFRLVAHRGVIRYEFEIHRTKITIKSEINCGRSEYSFKIPVFANGDIASREDYLNVKEMTGCFGVSVGRGAMGKPYVFAEISGNDFSFDLMSAIKKHFEILLSFMPERLCVNEMKKHICCYLKGIKGSRKAMPLLQSACTAEETLRLVDEFLSFDASC